MRKRIILAATLTVISAATAHAEDWCGYAPKNNAMIECGYSTVAQCEDGVGKGATCFVDPDYALNSNRAAHAITLKLPAKHG